MNYVCFRHPSGESFALKRLLSLLPENGERYWIGEQKKQDADDVKMIPLSALAELDPTQTLALVTHPYWIRVINQFQPKHVIAIIPFQETGEDPQLQEKYWAHLAAQATMVCTDSERVYLEQCFKRDAVFFMHSENNLTYDIHPAKNDTLLLSDCEVLFRDAVARMLSEQPVNDLVECQWRTRIAHYQEIEANIVTSETPSFLLSVYHYLLGQTETAGKYLLKSYEHALLSGHADCLTSHYRFLSAIEAKAGKLEQAVSTYGITAVQPDARASYRNLIDLLDHGECDVARAYLYFLNDDYRAAAPLLSRIPAESARRNLFQSYLRMGQLDHALRLLKPADLCTMRDRREYLLLKGTAEAMKANRHEAVHCFLQAASNDYEAIAHILEMQAVDERVAEFIRGEQT